MAENTSVWPGWETKRVIGRGSFGTVYEIQRKLNNHIEKAALKVISLPKDASEIDAMYRDGYDEKSITLTFECHRNRIIDEYSFSREVRSANIVYCEEFRDIQRDDGIGWDIFIKMELLTSLTEALPERITESVVIKLGMDICKALVVCQKHGIVHRDIKPENIFVSDNGEYKLGDFGIAKIAEKATSGTMAGTYKYMAPEVYNNQPYGSAADIYSLGLVLYWLLNERRMPFTPLPPTPLTSDIDEKSWKRRFSGEALPAPKNGSKALKDIVLKACAYKSADRYSSAEEMLDDLKKLNPDYVNEFVFKTSSDKNEDDSHRDTSVDERTISVFHTHKYSTEWTKDGETHWHKCKKCGAKTDVSGHTFGDWIITKSATETSTGAQERTCVCCGHKETQTIPVLPHTHSYSTEWTTDSETHWRECKCGDKTDVSSHTFGDWMITQSATETSTGAQERTCVCCGHKETQTIPVLQHTHSYSTEWTKDSETHWRECKCGDKTDVSSHTFGDWMITQSATETSTGVQERACVCCGHKETQIIPVLPHTHSYSTVWLSDSNSHWKECSCGEKANVSSHSYGSWETVKTATSTKAGEKTRTCSVCGYAETETIAPIPAPTPVPDGPPKKEDGPPKKSKSKKKIVITICAILAALPIIFVIFIVLLVLLLRGCDNTQGNDNKENSRNEIIVPGEQSYDNSVSDGSYEGSGEGLQDPDHAHEYSSEWTVNAIVHWRECGCGDTTDEGYHEYGEWVITTAATETTTGMQEHTCSYCGYKETEVIPVLQHTHSYSAGWISNSSSHWNVCSCGEKANVSSHTFGSWKTVKAATCVKSGERTRTCSACGYAETQTFSASHSYSQGVCASCGKLQSEGLKIGIETVNGKKQAVVYSVGTCKDSNIYIPAKYNGVPVTTIGHSAFHKCTNIVSVTIPNSVTAIENGAFTGCSGLARVIFTDTSKWYITQTEGATSGQFVDVTNPNQAAQYFETYRYYYWYKK